MKKGLFLVLSCFVLSAYAQQGHDTGVILDSLSVGDNSKETFALYLPTRFKSDKISSILIVFSPSGRGKKDLEVFRKAAEEYNYILVCSNNSRNGPVDENFAIAQRLFNHVFSSFAIDENRIYLAGFSGGSRLASGIATLSNQIQGVIGCGAGFLPSSAYKPSNQGFSFVGLCGDRDMNYPEMVGTKAYLNKIKFNNTLFTFDGNHEWPPNEQVLMAFEWLEIEAHKKGHIKKTDAEIKTSYQTNLAYAKTALKNKQPLLSAAHYDRTIDSYGSFFNLDSVRQELQNIRKSKAYTTAFKSRKKAFEKENELNLVFQNRFSKEYRAPEKATLKWWEKEFQKLEKQEVKADAQMLKMFERVRFKTFVMAYTQNKTSSANQKQKDYCKSLIKMLKEQLK